MTETTPAPTQRRKTMLLAISAVIAGFVLTLWTVLPIVIEAIVPGWGLITTYVLLFLVLWGVIYKYAPFPRA